MKIDKSMLGKRLLINPLGRLGLSDINECIVKEISEKGFVKLQEGKSSQWYTQEQIENIEVIEILDPIVKNNDFLDDSLIDRTLHPNEPKLLKTPDYHQVNEGISPKAPWSKRK